MQFRQQVAESAGFFAFTDTQHVIVRGFHLVVWHDDAANAALTRFNGTYRCTFFVQQVRRNWHRHNRVNLFGVLFQRFFFNQTQDGEGQRFVITHGTGAGAARADVMAGLTQRRAQTLAGHLQQAKARDMANLDTRAILTHRFAQAVFNRALVANRRHVNEVDNNQTAQVAQAELAGDFISGFQVGVEGRLFDVAAACCTRGVDVDSGQRFSGIDNDRTAGREAHFTLEGRLNLGFDLIMAEQRDFTGVQLNFAGEIRTT